MAATTIAAATIGRTLSTGTAPRATSLGSDPHTIIARGSTTARRLRDQVGPYDESVARGERRRARRQHELLHRSGFRVAAQHPTVVRRRDDPARYAIRVPGGP